MQSRTSGSGGGILLTNEWRRKSKQWGHPLHSMCSGMEKLPPRISHYFIQKFTRRGDAVLDPFSGGGTVPLQACVEGRVGIGIDAHPSAYALTLTKVKPPDPIVLRNRMEDLSNDMFFGDISHQPESIRLLFHDRTLSQIVFLKQTLDPTDRTDAFIIGVLLGILHGTPRNVRATRMSPPFLSISVPNTLDMSEASIHEYKRGRNIEAPNLDVFACLRARVDRFLRLGVPQTEGRAWNARVQDIHELPDPALRRKKVHLIVTSPPSPRRGKCGMADRVRLWFLGENPDECENRFDPHRNIEDYMVFIQNTSRLLYQVAAPGGICAMVVSDMPKRNSEPIRLAEEIWKHLKRKKTRWHLADILEDKTPPGADIAGTPPEKKQSRTAITDRVLVLYKKSYEEVRERVLW